MQCVKSWPGRQLSLGVTIVFVWLRLWKCFLLASQPWRRLPDLSQANPNFFFSGAEMTILTSTLREPSSFSSWWPCPFHCSIFAVFLSPWWWGLISTRVISCVLLCLIWLCSSKCDSIFLSGSALIYYSLCFCSVGKLPGSQDTSFLRLFDPHPRDTRRKYAGLLWCKMSFHTHMEGTVTYRCCSTGLSWT